MKRTIIDPIKLTFTAVKEIPTISRNGHSIYSQMIEKFLKGKSKTVQVNFEDEIKSTSLANALRASSRHFNLPIKVVERNGNVYLQKEEV